MRVMKFANPVFESGINLTVRKGDKWADLQSRQVVTLTNEDKDNVLGFAMILDVVHLNSFREIIKHEALLGFGHDSRCRDFMGLLCVMKEMYPDFTPDDSVTLVFFMK